MHLHHGTSPAAPGTCCPTFSSCPSSTLGRASACLTFGTTMGRTTSSFPGVPSTWCRCVRLLPHHLLRPRHFCPALLYAWSRPHGDGPRNKHRAPAIFFSPAMAEYDGLMNVCAVGGNAVSAFLSWRLQATNACDVTLVWKSGFDNVYQYGISFK